MSDSVDTAVSRGDVSEQQDQTSEPVVNENTASPDADTVPADDKYGVIVVLLMLSH